MKVLIAEDDPVSRRLLQSYLEKWGYEVTAANDGAAAWQLFQQDEFPIVISDWIMPEVDGLELVRRIRSLQRPFYVYAMLLTARSQKQDVVAGMEAGADDFISKPFDRDELRVRLREGERIVRLERSLAEQNRTLRETQAALVQSEKLAGLGHLAAGMAHEINNPIAYVTNNIAVLRRDMLAVMQLLAKYEATRHLLAQVSPEPAAELERMEREIDVPFLHENIQQLLDRSIDGLQRVRDIVRSLRDFARLDEAEFNELDLNAAVQSTLEIMRHEIDSKDVHVGTELEPLPPLEGHASKINQVLLNLLANAVQACSPGGHVVVRTRVEHDHAVLEVADDGSGIPPEHLPRIFEPFFTTRAVGEGKGLGLAISYGIVREHGGTIEVDTSVGRGSTFRVKLPLHTPVASSGNPAHAVS